MDLGLLMSACVLRTGIMETERMSTAGTTLEH